MTRLAQCLGQWMPDVELAAAAVSVFVILAVLISCFILIEHGYETLRSMAAKRRLVESNPQTRTVANPVFSPQLESGWQPLTTSLKFSPGQNDL